MTPESGWNFKVGWSAQAGMVIVYLVVSSWDVHELLAEPSAAMEYGIPLIAVGIFFGSILAHELGHAVTMELAGIRVRQIGLEIWGGYTQPAGGVSLFSLPAGKYFWSTFAGPATNLAIAFVIWRIVLEAPGVAESRDLLREPDNLARFFLGWAALLNAYLGVINLLPVFPLDGGHVFRAVLMGLTGGVVIATVVAGGVSLALAAAGIAYGVIETLDEGWSSVPDTGPLLVYATVGVVGSLAALGSLFIRGQEPEPEVRESSNQRTKQLELQYPTETIVSCALCERSTGDFTVHGGSQREVDVLLEHVVHLHPTSLGERNLENKTYTVEPDGRTLVSTSDGLPLMYISNRRPAPRVMTQQTQVREPDYSIRSRSNPWVWWMIGIAVAIGVLAYANSASGHNASLVPEILQTEPTPSPEFGSVNIHDLKEGDCFNAFIPAAGGRSFETVERVPCSGQWQHRIVRSVLLAHALGVPHPQETYLQQFVEEQCPAETSFFLYPDFQGWDLGDRVVRCIESP